MQNHWFIMNVNLPRTLSNQERNRILNSIPIVSNAELSHSVLGGYVASYNCPHCKDKLRSKEKEIGTEEECPGCGGKFVLAPKFQEHIIREKKNQQEAKQLKQQERQRLKDKKREEQDQARQKKQEERRINQERESIIEPVSTHRRSQVEADIVRYPALQAIAGVYKGVGFLFMGLSLLALALSCVSLFSDWIEWQAPLIAFVVSFLVSLTFLAIGESFQIFIDIEKNTRLARYQ